MISSALALTTPQISTKSDFADSEWLLDRRIPGESPNKINWDFRLPDATSFLDAQNHTLLESTKVFISLLISGQDIKTLRSSSVSAAFELLTVIIAWMNGRGFRSYSEINEEHLEELSRYLAERKVRKNGPGRKSVETERTWSKERASRAFAVLLKLAQLHDRYPDALNVAEDRVREFVGDFETGRTKRIPDEVYRSIMTTAVDWVTNNRDGLSARDAELWSIRTSHPPRTAAYWYAKDYKSNKPTRIVRIAGRDVDISTHRRKAISSLMNFLSIACFIVIAGLCGMRVSEILSLRRDCLRTRTTDNGEILLVLRGQLFKTSNSDSGEECEWVAGWDSPNNPVRLAVESLIDIVDRRGPSESSRPLFSALPEYRGDENEERRRHAIAGKLNAFSALNGIASWRFAPHQFRKAFARHLTLTTPYASLILKQHFKHVNIAMTERYIEIDPDLVIEILEESFALDMEALDLILSSGRLAGPLGDEIVKRNALYRGDKGAEARRKYLADLRRDPTFVMLRHVYGYCVFERFKARCGGEIANVGMWTCFSCQNCVVSEDHRPFLIEQDNLLTQEIEVASDAGMETSELFSARDAIRNLLNQLDQHGR